MRPFISATVIALSLAALPAAAHAQPARPAHGAVVHGLVLTPGGWGPLKLGMTNKQAQKTGMVTTKLDHCAPGYQMAKKFQGRGYVVWNGTFPTMTVGEIIVTGAKEHTSRHIHVGSTLSQLRHAYPGLSKVYPSSAASGRKAGADLYFAYVHQAHVGTMNFQFAYGPRPKSSSKIATIVIAPKRAVYFGC